MTIVFITGMSGVGKTSILDELSKSGINVVDSDYGYTIKNEDTEETLWDENKIMRLIDEYKNTHLVLSGCYANQSKFYKYFAYVVLLKADLKIIMQRINHRTNNDYGKSLEDKRDIINNLTYVQPLLEKSADIVIDTSYEDVEKIAARIKDLLLRSENGRKNKCDENIG